MPNQPSYKFGDWLATCDVCGHVYHASKLQKRWDSLMVCEQDYEERHPQDFVRGVRENIAPPWTRPMPEDVFQHQCDAVSVLGMFDNGEFDCALFDNEISQERLTYLNSILRAPDVNEEFGQFDMGAFDVANFEEMNTSITAYLPFYDGTGNPSTTEDPEVYPYTPNPRSKDTYPINHNINWIPEPLPPPPPPSDLYICPTALGSPFFYIEALGQSESHVYAFFEDSEAANPAARLGYFKINKITNAIDKINTAPNGSRGGNNFPVISDGFFYRLTTSGVNTAVTKTNLSTDTIVGNSVGLGTGVFWPALKDYGDFIIVTPRGSSDVANKTVTKIRKSDLVVVGSVVLPSFAQVSIDFPTESFAQIRDDKLWLNYAVPPVGDPFGFPLTAEYAAVDLLTMTVTSQPNFPNPPGNCLVVDDDFMWAAGLNLDKISKSTLAVISSIELGFNCPAMYDSGSTLWLLGDSVATNNPDYFSNVLTAVDKSTGNISKIPLHTLTTQVLSASLSPDKSKLYIFESGEYLDSGGNAIELSIVNTITKQIQTSVAIPDKKDYPSNNSGTVSDNVSAWTFGYSNADDNAFIIRVGPTPCPPSGIAFIPETTNLIVDRFWGDNNAPESILTSVNNDGTITVNLPVSGSTPGEEVILLNEEVRYETSLGSTITPLVGQLTWGTVPNISGTNYFYIDKSVLFSWDQETTPIEDVLSEFTLLTTPTLFNVESTGDVDLVRTTKDWYVTSSPAALLSWWIGDISGDAPAVEWAIRLTLNLRF